MAKHRFSPPLAGIDSLAFQLLRVYTHLRTIEPLQKRFFSKTRDLRKTGNADWLPAWSRRPSQRWPHRGQHQLRRPGFPRETDCMPEDTVLIGPVSASISLLLECPP